MSRVFFCTVVFLMACSAEPYMPDQGAGSGSGSGGAGGQCGPAVETDLPGHDGGSVVALCTACNDDCQERTVCQIYGDCCVNGPAGCLSTCGACCNGTQGELRCSCVGCQAAFRANDPTQLIPLLCTGSDQRWLDVMMCGCKGPCEPVCGHDPWCEGPPVWKVSEACAQCMFDFGAGCGAKLLICDQDI